MSIPHEAISAIYSGDALLFLGAGFCKGAISLSFPPSIEEADFPTGQTLADELLQSIDPNNKEHYSLDRCASFYESERDRNTLLRILAHRLKAIRIADFQKSILSLPWNRIYTTNYDNIIRDSIPNKQILHIGLNNLNDELPKNSEKKTSCYYINGYLDFIDPPLSNIVITKTDYELNLSARSNIIDNFRVDASLSKYIFFLGYSIYDIDIARILQNDISLCNKIFLIVGDNISSLDKTLIKKYGRVIECSCEAFWEDISKIDKSSLATANMPFCPSLTEYKISSLGSSDPIVQLVMHSKIDRSQLKQQMISGKRYALLREKLQAIRARIKEEKSLFIIHSHLCNGKSIFLEEIAAAHSDIYPIFIVDTNKITFESDAVAMAKFYSSQKIIFIIDGYAHIFQQLKRLVKRLDNVIFILAERTPIHRQLIGNAKELSDAEVYSIDQLMTSEVNDFVSFLLDNGFSGLSERKLADHITTKWGGSIGSAILALVDGSALEKKIMQEIKNDIELSGEYKDELYVTLILALILEGRTPKELINFFTQKNTAFTQKFIQSKLFDTLFIDGDDDVIVKGIIPLLVAKKIFEPDAAFKATINIARIARKRFLELPTGGRKILFETISREIMRYSTLSKIMPNENFIPNSVRFYDELKVDNSFGGFPLFWLQYAIAMINIKDYPMAKRYLDTAVESAKRIGFDDYQIRNQYARLLLMCGDSLGMEAYERFDKARNFLLSSTHDYTDPHVFHAAAAMSAMKKDFQNFTISQLKSVEELIRLLNKAHDHLPPDVQYDVRHDIQRINETQLSLQAFHSR